MLVTTHDRCLIGNFNLAFAGSHRSIFIGDKTCVLFQRGSSQTTFSAENFSWNECRKCKQTWPGLNGILSNVTGTIESTYHKVILKSKRLAKKQLVHCLSRRIIIAVKVQTSQWERLKVWHMFHRTNSNCVFVLILRKLSRFVFCT